MYRIKYYKINIVSILDISYIYIIYINDAINISSIDSELLLIITLNNYMNETTKVILLFMKFIRHDIQTNSYYSTLLLSMIRIEVEQMKLIKNKIY